jgi:peptide/nickel transport system substrate-binding protein
MKGRRLARMVAVIATTVGLAALAACSSSSGGHGGTLSGISGGGLYGTVPAATGTAHAGTIKFGQPTGIVPWILPIQTVASNSIYTTYNFDYQMYRPLYWFGDGTTVAENKPESIADDPVWSNGDKTVSVTLKSNYKWSNGQPITSKDVEFWYDLTKAAVAESAANWAIYVPGEGLPDEVASVSTPSSSTIVFNLKKAVNPTWFFEEELQSLQPMPSSAWSIDATGGKTLDFTVPANATKIYNYLSNESKSVSTYASNPLWQIVDGPYKLTTFNSTSDDYDFAPNPAYGGPRATPASSLDVISYASDAAEYNALKAGALDVGYIPSEDVADAKSLSSSYSIFGYPGYGWQGAFYNFKDTTGDFGKVISQLYVRQALQHLVNQQGIIDAYLHGAGGVDYGTVGQYPPTKYTPSDDLSNLYPYSTTDAMNLLKSHGWKVVPGGTDTCAKPGTAANECGTGIPAGTKLAFNFLYPSSVTYNQQVATELTSVAKSVGIDLTLQSETFADLTSNYDDVANPSFDNKWAVNFFGGETDNFYPTTFGLFNATGSANFGEYSDPTANSLVNASVNSTSPAAVENELSYLAKDLPVWFVPNPDWAGSPGPLAVSKSVSGPPASFEEYAEYWLAPELWYLKS